MNIFITHINGLGGTAQYAQTMVVDIAHKLGFKSMEILLYNTKGESVESLSSRYDGIIAGIASGDIVFFQYPTWHNIKFETGLIDRIKAYRGRIVIVIHDIEALMIETSRFMLSQSIELFNRAEALVVPSCALQKFLLDNGVKEDICFVIQEIWDYTTDINFLQEPEFKKELHFAGYADKVMVSNYWNYEILLKIYTAEQCTGKNVQVMGRINPAKLLLELGKGGFGLVWYGSEYWHQYMAYNNSLKLSTYLAAGIPVIVPRGISNQYLIEENHLGIVVDSLEEAIEKVENMLESEYMEYVQDIKRFAPLIRSGYFTQKFLIEAVHTVLRNDEKH